MWWFHWPGNAYVSVTAAVDFSGARAYLEQLNREADTRVKVNDLVVAAAVRVMCEFPEANAWITGNRIRRQRHVGVGMPVNLEGHQAGKQQETSIAVVQRAEALTLRQVAWSSRREVHAERHGEHTNRLVGAVSGILGGLPFGVLARGLDLLNLASRVPRVRLEIQRQLGFTTVVTNAGAPFDRMQGVLFRGGAFELPQRLFHVGTVWGISAVQDEVLAIDGEPRVCPVLPVVMVFDHRLFDGVKAGKILMRLMAIIQKPATVLGADGDQRIGT